jgi:ABC-type transport system involved in multi-copper enzyme maturation permease subunit
VNVASEVGLIVGRELKKNFRSIKGIILAALTLLGGGGVGALLAWVDKRALEAGITQADIAKEQTPALVRGYGMVTGEYLASAPPSLLSVQLVMVWLAPMLVALMGFDAVSGEIQHRSLRFWTVRCRRVSFYLGKVLGIWAVVSTLTFAMSFIVWIFCMGMGAASVGAIMKWGLRFWIASLPLSLMWVSLAVMLGGLFRTPILSLLTIFGAFFLVWVFFWVVPGIFGAPDWKPDVPPTPFWDALKHVYPNHYDRYLLSPKPGQVIAGIAGCLTFAALPAALGSYLLQRRDV